MRKKKQPNRTSRKRTAIENLSTCKCATSITYVVIRCMYLSRVTLSENIELLQKENCYDTVKTKTEQRKIVKKPLGYYPT